MREPSLVRGNTRRKSPLARQFFVWASLAFVGFAAPAFAQGTTVRVEAPALLGVSSAGNVHTLRVRPGAPASFFAWVERALKGQHPPVTLEHTAGGVLTTLSNARVLGVTFPRVASGDEQSSALEVVITGDPARRGGKVAPVASAKKVLKAGAFRVSLNGKPVSIVSAEAFGVLAAGNTSLTRRFLPELKAQLRLRNRTEVDRLRSTLSQKPVFSKPPAPSEDPASIEIPNLVVTVAESHADEFNDWHKDFVIHGDSDEKKEKTLTLEYLDADPKEPLISVTCKHPRVVRIGPPLPPGPKRLRAEVVCKALHFRYWPAVTLD